MNKYTIVSIVYNITYHCAIRFGGRGEGARKTYYGWLCTVVGGCREGKGKGNFPWDGEGVGGRRGGRAR